MYDRASTSVNYTVEVVLSGFSLFLLNLFGRGRSVNELLVGGGEWGPAPQIDISDLLEQSPPSGLFGGAVNLGKSVGGIEWE
jgi:hypothetical protein